MLPRPRASASRRPARPSRPTARCPRGSARSPRPLTASRSTNTHDAAPRESASMPSAPLPAKRSATRASASSVDRSERVEDRLARSVARRSGVAPWRRHEPAPTRLPADHTHRRCTLPSTRHRRPPIVGMVITVVRIDQPAGAQRDQHRDCAAPPRRVPRVRGGRRREGRDPHRGRDRVLRGGELEGPPPTPPDRTARADSSAAVEARDRGDRRVVRRGRARARLLVRPACREQHRPPGLPRAALRRSARRRWHGATSSHRGPRARARSHPHRPRDRR